MVFSLNWAELLKKKKSILKMKKNIVNNFFRLRVKLLCLILQIASTNTFLNI